MTGLLAGGRHGTGRQTSLGSLSLLLLLLLSACGGGNGQDGEPSDSDVPPTSDACAGVDCSLPPSAVCEGDERVSFRAGQCEEGECVWESVREACPGGCREGACIPPASGTDADPRCDGVVCESTDLAFCDGTTSAVPQRAECVAGNCVGRDYVRTDCSDRNELCRNGFCTVPPGCDEERCDSPPPGECDNGVYTGFEPFGSCETGTCVYEPLPEPIDCRALGEECTAEGCTSQCTDIVCSAPPANRCDNDTAVRFAAAGSCDLGQCRYDETREDCAVGGDVCIGGHCVPECQGVLCNSPPEAVCDGQVRQGFAPIGTCGPDGCEYAPVATDCSESGRECVAGECATRCGEAFCNEPPPPECDGGTLIAWSPYGECEGGTCNYEQLNVDCAASGLTCEDGACVDPCAGVSCTVPPPPVCSDDFELVFHGSTTTCVMGECAWDAVRETQRCTGGQMCRDGACTSEVSCGDASECLLPPARCVGNVLREYVGDALCRDEGRCDFEFQRVDRNCTTNGLVCRSGQCVEPVCRDEDCANPPADECDGAVAVSYAPGGQCEEEVCVYEETRENCASMGRTCFGGQCYAAGPCAGVTCDIPPPPRCDGRTAIRFGESGQCLSGDCVWNELEEDCAAQDLFCHDGRCVAEDRCVPTACNVPEPVCAGNVAVQAISASCEEGQCSFEAVEDDCSNGDRRCEDGFCVGQNACEGRVCPESESTACDGNTLVTTLRDGSCAQGVCTVSETRLPCGLSDATCHDGSCVAREGFCDTVQCTAPEPFCDGDVAVTFGDVVPCDAELGRCDVQVARVATDCAASALQCQQGRCVAIPEAGELAITEFLASTSLGSPVARYVEITNVGTRTLDLRHVVFRSDSGMEVFPAPFGSLQEGQRMVVGYGAIPAALVDLLVDEGEMPIRDNVDSLRIDRVDGGLIHEVSYSTALGWPIIADRALQVSATAPAGASGLLDWCVAQTPIPGAPGLFGTPGEENDVCETSSVCFEDSCTNLPEPVCINQRTRFLASGPGVCLEDGSCDFEPVMQSENCNLQQGEGCLDGECMAPTCAVAGDCALAVPEDWTCFDERFRFRMVIPATCGMDGRCQFAEGGIDVDDCGTTPGGRCVDGLCEIPPRPPLPGEVILSELLLEPPSAGPEVRYVEVLNVSAVTHQMHRLQLANRAGALTQELDLPMLPPGERHVIAFSSELSVDFADVTVAEEDFFLDPFQETIELRIGTTVVLSMQTGSVMGFVAEPGQALASEPSVADVESMQDYRNWCPVVSTIADYPGLRGRPGVASPGCGRAAACNGVDCPGSVEVECEGVWRRRLSGTDTFCSVTGACEGIDRVASCPGSMLCENAECSIRACGEQSDCPGPVAARYCDGNTSVVEFRTYECMDSSCHIVDEGSFSVDCAQAGSTCNAATGDCIARPPMPGELFLVEVLVDFRTSGFEQALELINISEAGIVTEGVMVASSTETWELSDLVEVLSPGDSLLLVTAGLNTAGSAVSPAAVSDEPLFDVFEDVVAVRANGEVLGEWPVGATAGVPLELGFPMFVDPAARGVGVPPGTRIWCPSTVPGLRTAERTSCGVVEDCTSVSCPDQDGGECLSSYLSIRSIEAAFCVPGGLCSPTLPTEIAACDVQADEICEEGECGTVGCSTPANCPALSTDWRCVDQDRAVRAGAAGTAQCTGGTCTWQIEERNCAENGDLAGVCEAGFCVAAFQ